ncbi:MAG TPA: gamma-glutamyltransferase, partial [Thermoanaerobaculia bacterium]|nr:gamma-glutamyltransferase [Thermoanaerobaculia bacterium]
MIARALLLLAVTFGVTPLRAGSQVVAREAAIATGSRLSTAAGLEVLRNGGSAADAAVAAAFTLAVCHPQAGNLGGGGVLLYYDSASGAVWTLDFRVSAPSARQSIGEETGSKTPIGVPGTVAGLESLHQRFGRLRWSELLAPPAALAREGYVLDDEIAEDLAHAREQRKIDRFPTTASIFFPRGNARTAGDTLVQPDLASTLEQIGRQGARELYSGATSKRIVAAAVAAGAAITPRDLEQYRPVWRAPIRLDYGMYRIHVPPPPFAGGIILAEGLQILDEYQPLDPREVRGVHLLAEAERRAFLDVGHFFRNPGRRLPLEELVSSEHAARWKQSLDSRRASSSVMLAAKMFQGDPVAGEHTTHISVADPEGNLASVTLSLGENFGSGLVVEGGGFFLNQIQSATAEASSSSSVSADLMMTPALVFAGEDPLLVIGSRGGAMIPTTLLQIFVDLGSGRRSLAEAVAAPRFHHQGF